MSGGLTIGVLIRIGDGAPNEIAETAVPLRAKLVPDALTGSAYIELDYEQVTNSIRAALYEVADKLPVFRPHPDAEETP